jgi:hypothetical protein
VRGVQNLLFSQWESEYEKKGTVNSCENEREANVKRDRQFMLWLINQTFRWGKERDAGHLKKQLLKETVGGKKLFINFEMKFPFLFFFCSHENILFRSVSVCNHVQDYGAVSNKASEHNGRQVIDFAFVACHCPQEN